MPVLSRDEKTLTQDLLVATGRPDAGLQAGTNQGDRDSRTFTTRTRIASLMKLPSVIVIGLAASLASLNAAQITTNVARAGTIVEASAVHSAPYPATGVIDGNVVEGTNTTVSYWLAPNGVTNNVYFILDLRGSFPIEALTLYNTHNRQHYDRGTGAFAVHGAAAIEPRQASSGKVDGYYMFGGDLKDSSERKADGAFYDVMVSPATPIFSDDAPPGVANRQSLTFSGAGEFMEIIDPPGFVQPTSYSVSIWVKFLSVQPCALVLRTSPKGEYTDFSHVLRVNPAGAFESFVWEGVANQVTGTTTLEPDRWYHVAVTAQNGGMHRLYVNGVEEGIAQRVATMWQAGDRWRVGTGLKGGFYPLAGTLDELGLWYSAPLSSDQIARLSNGESPIVITNAPVAGGHQLVNPQLLASGTLTQVVAGDPVIPPQTFPVSPPATVRFLQFQALGSAHANNNVGLNELQAVAKIDLALPNSSIKPAVHLSWPHLPYPVTLQRSPSLVNPNWDTVTNAPKRIGTTWELYMPAEPEFHYRLINSVQ
jgi:hypothetical protein